MWKRLLNREGFLAETEPPTTLPPLGFPVSFFSLFATAQMFHFIFCVSLFHANVLLRW